MAYRSQDEQWDDYLWKEEMSDKLLDSDITLMITNPWAKNRFYALYFGEKSHKVKSKYFKDKEAVLKFLKMKGIIDG